MNAKWPARLRAALLTPMLPALLLVSLALNSLAFQLGGNYSINAAQFNTHPYFVNFEPIEGPPDNRFRWSLPDNCICIPGTGSYPLTLNLRLAGVLTPGEQRSGELLVNGQKVGDFTLREGWNELSFAVSRAQIGPSGDLKISINMPPLELAGDPRPLVAQVSTVSVVRSPGSRVWPAPEQLTVMLLAVLLCYLCAALLDVRPTVAALIAGGLGAIWAVGMALWHLPVSLAGTRLAPVLLATSASVLAGRAAGGRLFQRSGTQPTVRQWQVLCAAFAFGVLFKAGGMFHPAFLVLDHGARVHQLARFGMDPLGFIATYIAAPPEMGLGGQLDLGTAMPYSPFFYIVFSPLNWFLQEDRPRIDTLNLTLAILEASSVFGLYYVLRKVWNNGLAGACAAAVFVTVPLSNLLFSDGGYPSIFAQWLLVLNVAAFASTFPWLRWRSLVPSALILAMLLLSHTATMLLVAVQLIVFVFVLLLVYRSRFGRALAWASLGSLVAFATYYVFTLPLVFGEILPTVLSRLSSKGTLGQDPENIGSPLLAGFWPQIAAHFQAWPLALSIAGCLMLAGTSMGRRTYALPRSVSAQPLSSRADLRKGMTLWFGAWLVSFALFSVLDLSVNLLQKHMQFAIPLLAMLSGLSMSYLWRRGRTGKLLVALLVGTLAWSSIVIWSLRVLERVLPPGSG